MQVSHSQAGVMSGAAVSSGGSGQLSKQMNQYFNQDGQFTTASRLTFLLLIFYFHSRRRGSQVRGSRGGSGSWEGGQGGGPGGAVWSQSARDRSVCGARGCRSCGQLKTFFYFMPRNNNSSQWLNLSVNISVISVNPGSYNLLLYSSSENSENIQWRKWSFFIVSNINIFNVFRWRDALRFHQRAHPTLSESIN